MKKKEVAIVHFNTPELTEATILSLRKHGGEDYHVTVFDNSDTRPFTKKMKGVTILDNTKGQLIDFARELEKYPERDPKVGVIPGCEFGSDKHMMTVQLLWDILPDGFLLLDSDVLVKKSLEPFFREDLCAVGHVAPAVGLTNYHERYEPFLLWINVPRCKAAGAVFFDPKRAWALHHGAANPCNHWDTGAAFLADIRRLKPDCKGKNWDTREYIEHLAGGSYRNNKDDIHHQWLENHRVLWASPKPRKRGEKRYTVLTYIFNDYEIVHEVEHKDPDADYILVTDDPELKSKTWKVVHDKSLAKFSTFDKCYYVRWHPWRYAKTDIVVRIDGSMAVTGSLAPLIDTFEVGGYDLSLMIHPDRQTMPEEYSAWVRYRNYPKAQAEKCLAYIHNMGHPDTYRGQFQLCFSIHQRNAINEQLLETTYQLLRHVGGATIERLDQTIFSVIMARLFPTAKVMPVGEGMVTHGSMFQWYLHKSNTPIKKGTSTAPYMFNRPVTLLFR